jgi:transcriptional regulator
MSEFTSRFAPQGPGDGISLLAASPLGWIVSYHRDQPFATVLPFKAHTDEDGNICSLRGHFARANPQLAALHATPRALILILGPNAYVSPSWMADRTQAPTWNYASMWFETELHFFEDRQRLRELLEDQVGAMEAGRDQAWQIPDMGSRYERLATAIVGFDAQVIKPHSRFKLGQDEREDVYPDIVRGLKGEGADALLAWMARFNPNRI